MNNKMSILAISILILLSFNPLIVLAEGESSLGDKDIKHERVEQKKSEAKEVEKEDLDAETHPNKNPSEAVVPDANESTSENQTDSDDKSTELESDSDSDLNDDEDESKDVEQENQNKELESTTNHDGNDNSDTLGGEIESESKEKDDKVNSQKKDEEGNSQEEDSTHKQEKLEQGNNNTEDNGGQPLNDKSSPPYKDGDRNSQVVELKKKLSRVGIGNYPKSPSSYYGDSTMYNVKEFQGYYGLNQTGTADQATLNKLDEILSSDYQSGKKGNHATELKKKLTRLGIGNYPSSPSQRYGGSTAYNVKVFQKKYGLLVNGIADSVTLNKLNELMDVIQLKKNLTQLGIGNYPKNPSPNLGGASRKNVMKFQSYYGLNQTGTADQATLNQIDKILSSDYQSGKKGTHVTELKEKLTQLGIGNYPSSPSQRYGGSTAYNVKVFQEKYGLLANGIADSVTLDKLNELMDVIQLKKNLTQLGIGNYPKNPSPNFGGASRKNVMKFQSYYGLNQTGTADQATLNQVDKILSSDYQSGKKGTHVTELKKNLTQLGIGNYPSSPSQRYGGSTAYNVKVFQKKFSLLINGIADEVTLAKIDELVDSIEEPTETITNTQYGVTLNQALNTQMNQLQQTDKYRNDPAYVSTKYVDITEHHFVNNNGVRIRTSTSLKNNSNVELTANDGDKVTILGEVKGDAYKGSTKWYKINYKNSKKTLYVHSELVGTTKTAKVTANLNVRAKTNASSHKYGQLSKGTSINIVSEGNNWHEIKYKVWRNPTKSAVETYLNPKNNDQYQHLVLSSSIKVPARELNKVLDKKGILHGQGQAFIDGGKQHAVNELYLISHAFLESGHGTSKLANGVEVGKNKSGKPVLVTKGNRNQLTVIKTTYNMFGIGASDADPLKLGAVYAYEKGWFTPEAAIKGGAKFIGDRYINSSHKQNTLYKMRWNPGNPGVHQYATDIGWATKQVSTLKSLYKKVPNATKHFDIPKYK